MNQLLSSEFPVRAFKIKIEPLHLRTSTIQVTTCDSLERNFKWKKKELGERVPTKFMNSFYHSFESILLWMKSNGVAIFQTMDTVHPNNWKLQGNVVTYLKIYSHEHSWNRGEPASEGIHS